MKSKKKNYRRINVFHFVIHLLSADDDPDWIYYVSKKVFFILFQYSLEEKKKKEKIEKLNKEDRACRTDFVPNTKNIGILTNNWNTKWATNEIRSAIFFFYFSFRLSDSIVNGKNLYSIWLNISLKWSSSICVYFFDLSITKYAQYLHTYCHKTNNEKFRRLVENKFLLRTFRPFFVSFSNESLFFV